MLSFLRKTALWIVLLPLLFTYLGAASNQLVLNANSDTFPVRINATKILIAEKGETEELPNGDKLVGNVLILADGTIMLDDTHCVMTDKTHLNFLADVIDLRGVGIESVGDIMLDLGDWSWNYAPLVWGLVVIGRLRKREEEY